MDKKLLVLFVLLSTDFVGMQQLRASDWSSSESESDDSRPLKRGAKKGLPKKKTVPKKMMLESDTESDDSDWSSSPRPQAKKTTIPKKRPKSPARRTSPKKQQPQAASAGEKKFYSTDIQLFKKYFPDKDDMADLLQREVTVDHHGQDVVGQGMKLLDVVNDIAFDKTVAEAVSFQNVKIVTDRFNRWGIAEKIKLKTLVEEMRQSKNFQVYQQAVLDARLAHEQVEQEKIKQQVVQDLIQKYTAQAKSDKFNRALARHDVEQSLQRSGVRDVQDFAGQVMKQLIQEHDKFNRAQQPGPAPTPKKTDAERFKEFLNEYAPYTEVDGALKFATADDDGEFEDDEGEMLDIYQVKNVLQKIADMQLSSTALDETVKNLITCVFRSGMERRMQMLALNTKYGKIKPGLQAFLLGKIGVLQGDDSQSGPQTHKHTMSQQEFDDHKQELVNIARATMKKAGGGAQGQEMAAQRELMNWRSAANHQLIKEQRDQVIKEAQTEPQPESESSDDEPSEPATSVTPGAGHDASGDLMRALELSHLLKV